MKAKPVDAWTCGRCGEEVDSGFEVCWSCGLAYDEIPTSAVEKPEPPPVEPDAVCPMCGEAIVESDEECPHCGERFDGLPDGHPAKPADDGEDSEQVRRTGEVLTRAYRFLQENPNPTNAEIRIGISGNLCRCTGYQSIVKAIRSAADKLNQAEGAE